MAVRHGLALLVIGVWLGALAGSWVSATASFRGVDRVLGPGMRPELDRRLSSLDQTERRATMRHLAAEINRWMFRRLGLAQIVLGLLALWAAWPGPGARWLMAVALLVAAVQLALGGAIEALGRSLDFLPRPLPADLGSRFGLLHAAFLLLDAGKAGLLAGAAYALARRPF